MSTEPTPSERYGVRVAKDYLVFAAGHYITFDADRFEPIHGHNWRVALEAEGPLTENGYVVDFIALKKLGRRITDELDHKMLLQGESEHVSVERNGSQCEVRFKDKFWSFPSDECLVLPLANTTAELLARYIAERMIEGLGEMGVAMPDMVRVTVEETFNQGATYERRLRGERDERA